MWNRMLDLLFLEQVSSIFTSFVVEIDLDKISLSCHLLLIYSATKKVRMFQHENPLGTIVHRVSFLNMAPLPPL